MFLDSTYPIRSTVNVKRRYMDVKVEIARGTDMMEQSANRPVYLRNIMALELTLYPASILRRRAPAVERIDELLRDRVREMFEVMYREHGVGLAAPQVSWSTRLFVINLAGEPDDGEELVFINPQIVASSKDEDIDEEGCLSIPEIRGNVARSLKIRVKAQNLEGKWFELEAEDLLCRAIQHELDHLDGILFIQRLSPTDQLAVKKQLKKLEKQSPSRTSARR